MTFQDVLAQAIDWLQRDQRITYRALKRQFDLDDEYLDDLRDELIEAKQIAKDEKGKILVWTGEPTSTPTVEARDGTEVESRFHAMLPDVMARLQRDGRVTYQTLKFIFNIDELVLAAIRKELHLRRLAVDEEGEVLAWIGLPALKADAPVAPQADAQLPPSQPIRDIPEAERRQLTVMFCDLADSTKLSQQLDPEDLRDVIRAYQQTSADVIQQFDGYIAQHLGDGLLIYFGWPRAHEDDAQRALHAGLGIVEAVTTTLNPRLEQEKGVQLTVRLGVHTGPVVVGQMGGDGRQEHLATGETVNIAARLESLAPPNTVAVSSVTERLVRGAFVFDCLGPHDLKGVAEPMTVFRALGPAKVHHDEEAAMPHGGAFLVGRDEELGLLLRRWEQAKEGLGQVVLISGEAGIGKSSLVAAMRAQVVDEGYTRLTFRSSPYHTHSALYPITTHFERLLGFGREERSMSRLEMLEQTLRASNLPVRETEAFDNHPSIPLDPPCLAALHCLSSQRCGHW